MEAVVFLDGIIGGLRETDIARKVSSVKLLAETIFFAFTVTRPCAL